MDEELYDENGDELSYEELMWLVYGNAPSV